MLTLDAGDEVLLGQAREAAEAAYAPYSRFPVGAAVRTDIGVFTGCNIENASFGLTVCAERVAVWTAIARGARRIEAVAVACVQADAAAGPNARMPCGACRQVLSEFMAPDGWVLVDGCGKWPLSEMLPHAFYLPKGSAGGQP